MNYDNFEQAVANFDGRDFECWHLLLDDIIAGSQLRNDPDLAFLLCRKAGRTGERDYARVSRSLNHWRSGSHVPNRRNFRLLTDALGIRKNPALEAVWNDLYRKELQRRPKAPSSLEAKSKPAGRREVLIPNRTVFAMAATVVAALLVATLAGYQTVRLPEASLKQADPVRIRFQPDVLLEVGQSVTLHGFRSKCGEAAPDVAKTRKRLPGGLEHGVLTAGRTGVRYSRSCGGFTPAREVVYEAKSPGVDAFVLFGDPMKVTVIPSQ